MAYNLAKELSKQFNVVLLSLRDGPLIDAFRDVATEVWTPRRGLPKHQRAALAIKALSIGRSLRFAILNSAMSHPVADALAQNRVPMVTLVHEFVAYLALDETLKRLFKQSDALVFEAPLTEQDAARRIGFPPNTLVRVYPQGHCVLPGAGAPDAERKRDLSDRIRPQGQDGSIVVLGVGGAEYRKGIDLFVQTAALARRLAPDLPWRFVWIGFGLTQIVQNDFRLYILDQIDRSGVADIVTLVPPTSELTTAYHLADAVFQSSRLEPLGNVGIDALAYGLPVFCFDRAAGIVDLLQEADLSDICVAPYLHTTAMAEKLVAWARSPEAQAKAASLAPKLVESHLRFDDYAAKLTDLAETVIASRTT
ncbi:MAG: glycosyltransferase family 4 protein [Tabrizicola sp.]|nr:glycosyltransferase family 4 protein [Tabrizicola sp.]